MHLRARQQYMQYRDPSHFGGVNIPGPPAGNLSHSAGRIKSSGFASGHPHRCPFCLVWLKNRGRFLVYLVVQSSTRAIHFPKKTPMVLRCIWPTSKPSAQGLAEELGDPQGERGGVALGKRAWFECGRVPAQNGSVECWFLFQTHPKRGTFKKDRHVGQTGAEYMGKQILGQTLHVGILTAVTANVLNRCCSSFCIKQETIRSRQTGLQMRCLLVPTPLISAPLSRFVASNSEHCLALQASLSTGLGGLGSGFSANRWTSRTIGEDHEPIFFPEIYATENHPKIPFSRRHHPGIRPWGTDCVTYIASPMRSPG